MVEKKSVLSLATIAFGAVLNIVLSFLLIPKFGVMGASFATFVSYISVFILRRINTSQYVKMKWHIASISFSVIMLLLQSVLLIKQVPYYGVYQVLIFLIIFVVNVRPIVQQLYKIIRRKKRQS